MKLLKKLVIDSYFYSISFYLPKTFMRSWYIEV